MDGMVEELRRKEKEEKERVRILIYDPLSRTMV
jgi:hypothetical protein